jgi:hypothetical protein
MNQGHMHCRIVDSASRSACPLGSRFEPSTLFGDDELKWVPLAELVGGMGIACIDGRHRECALGTPGGDTGELLLILSAVEQVRSIELGRELVWAALDEYAKLQGRFYLHTDSQALEALMLRVYAHDESRVADDNSSSMLARFINANAEERESLRAGVTRPEYLGCGHLRSMLLEPAAYGVRSKLSELVLGASFEALWDKSNLIQFSVLDGLHLERAVVSFHSACCLDDASAVPTPCGAGERGLFVHHGSVLEYIRHRTLERLMLGSLSQLKLAEVKVPLEAEIAHRACHHLGATLSRLAPKLDRYCVRYDCLNRRVQQSARVHWS